MNAIGMSSRAIKDFCILVGILAMFSIAGFQMLPAVIKFSIPQMIEKTTGRKALLSKLDLNPFSLKLCIGGFTLQEKDGKAFSAFDKFYIDIGVVDSIKQSALVIDELLLIKPSIRLVRHKDGRFNFDDIHKQKNESKQDDGSLFPVTIRNLSVSEGKLSWEDNQSNKPIREEVQSVNFEITDFSIQTPKIFPVHLFLVVKSVGKLDWRGVVGISPVFSSGHVKADDVDLKKIIELAVPNNSAFDLQGKGTLELDYKIGYDGNVIELGVDKSRLQLNEFQLSEKDPDIVNVNIQKSVLESDYQFTLNGSQWLLNAKKSKLEVENVRLPGLADSKAAIDVPKAVLEAGYRADYTGKNFNFDFTGSKLDVINASLAESGQNQKLVMIPEIAVQGVGFNLGRRDLTVKSAKAANAEIKAWLNAGGGINYLELFKGSNEKRAVSTEKTESDLQEETPWRISVETFELSNFDVAFEDRTQKTPVTIDADAVNLKLSNYSNQAGAKLPLQFSAGIDQTGTFKLDGDTIVDPFSARVNVAVKDIGLEKIQPYIQPHARLDLIDGKLEAEGFLTAAFPSEERPEIKFKGNMAIIDLLTHDQLLNKDFIKWNKMSLSDIDADVAANRYTADLLLIEKPYARVVIEKDTSINVNDVLVGTRGKTERSPAKPKTASNEDKVYLKLNKLQIVNGSSDFADLSLILPFAARIQSLNGGASGISSERTTTIKGGLRGNVYDLAPVEINGEISPYEGIYNVDMNFYGMPMPLVSPYMVQFAGYKVEKGKLTLGLKYKIKNGQLTASNNITIDQFELGEKVENPNAVSIPLKLAIALLKDSDGKINMDVPITGSLEDPKFSIGRLVREALVKSLAKVIASPFKAIGALGSVFGGGADLSTVSFPPGKAELVSEQMTKLYVIAQTLKGRPALILDIKGAAFEEDDWPALKEAALYDLAKKLKAAELFKKEGKKVHPKDIELTDDEYKRMLADKFIEKFPLLAERSLFGKPRLIHPEAGDFYEIAKQKLSELIHPEEGRLKRLAERRALEIATYIVQKGGISNDRVYVLDAAVDPKRETKDVVSFLSLKAK